jgi:hypothetical protein
MPEPFWKTETDLSDAEQERLKPETDFDSEFPDGAASSIESAMQIEYEGALEESFEDRARAVQQIDNDPTVRDLFEDDVYVSLERAEAAFHAVGNRAAGAGQSTRGVEANPAWMQSRADEFGKLVKTGEPDDPDYVQDNDVAPFGHPKRSIEDPPDGLSEEPFVEGVPESEEKREKIIDLAQERGVI